MHASHSPQQPQYQSRVGRVREKPVFFRTSAWWISTHLLVASTLCSAPEAPHTGYPETHRAQPTACSEGHMGSKLTESAQRLLSAF